RDHSENTAALVEGGDDLTRLPGIGADLAGKIAEIVKTGRLEALEELRRGIPAGLLQMLNLPGLGPKKVKALHDRLGISGLDELHQAAEAGKIRSLPGFGAKSEHKILEAIRARADTSRRFLRSVAVSYAEALAEYLRAVPGVRRVTIAGSYRRGRETVGDLDLLAIATKSSPIMDRFVAYDEVVEILSHGTTRSSVVLRSGLQVDVRVVPQRSYGAALHYFTGSKAHNIAIRRLGQKVGLKINEYGVFRGGRHIGGRNEEDVFGAVGLPYIEPELREERGEIEAAREGRLPKLVVLGDIQGDLHMHSTATDGHHSIEEMALAARQRRYRYIAITDHSRRLTVARGLDARRLRKQMEEIDRLNQKLSGITILKGIEVDILEDGSLDLPDEVLGDLDVVIGAVHSHFNLPRDKQTARILKAMDHPSFCILAHPSGRLLLSRASYEVDMERLLEHAAQRGCFMELNAHPERLDLDDVHCQTARELGVRIALGTDAHAVGDLDFMRYGISQARRGWLEPADVINTRPLGELRKLLRSVKGG
ncbi:MAG TPA: DNA polymerase/3'-5' exonuclease PolX, partial [Kiritimatiellae bacterium]|nr:DNA polymerase/3'-5' exonuclease PolX [Kiritimatiellia bacterium]